MTVKLNLSIDETIVRQIKSYARRKKTSVSKIVQEQLESILKTEEKDISFSEFLDQYAGSIKGNINYENEMDEYLKDKHSI